MDSGQSLLAEVERLLEGSRALHAAARSGDWSRVAELETARRPDLEGLLARISDASSSLDVATLDAIGRRLRDTLACDQDTAEAVASGRMRLGEELRALGRGAQAARRYHLSLVSARDC